ncbi:hypothetical protein DdX_12929 [Ditylenchus destructor]|uniref:Uncharacterized protein n=1 Tax=Ditylenchus destructor TaxID=166010 RepID=A0AAD4MXH8_9BILA|nr:hypothetical protein DdX_12929 [Ditylenchus destructor]
MPWLQDKSDNEPPIPDKEDYYLRIPFDILLLSAGEDDAVRDAYIGIARPETESQYRTVIAYEKVENVALIQGSEKTMKFKENDGTLRQFLEKITISNLIGESGLKNKAKYNSISDRIIHGMAHKEITISENKHMRHVSTETPAILIELLDNLESLKLEKTINDIEEWWATILDAVILKWHEKEITQTNFKLAPHSGLRYLWSQRAVVRPVKEYKVRTTIGSGSKGGHHIWNRSGRNSVQKETAAIVLPVGQALATDIEGGINHGRAEVDMVANIVKENNHKEAHYNLLKEITKSIEDIKLKIVERGKHLIRHLSPKEKNEKTQQLMLNWLNRLHSGLIHEYDYAIGFIKLNKSFPQFKITRRLSKELQSRVTDKGEIKIENRRPDEKSEYDTVIEAVFSVATERKMSVSVAGEENDEAEKRVHFDN